MRGGAEILEYEELQQLISIDGWRILRNLAAKHKQFLVEEAHRSLKKHDDRKAGEYLAKAEESLIFIDLVKERIKELSEKKEIK